MKLLNEKTKYKNNKNIDLKIKLGAHYLLTSLL